MAKSNRAIPKPFIFLYGGKFFTLEGSFGNLRVHTVKREIAKTFGMNSSQFHLEFEGKLLNEFSCLKEITQDPVRFFVIKTLEGSPKQPIEANETPYTYWRYEPYKNNSVKINLNR